ncbi:MAG: flagellar basal body P-ring formation chaperone FlgA [Pseudobdellovibrio sp.]
MKILSLFLITLISLKSFAQKGEVTISSATEISPRAVITAYDIIEGRNLSEDLLMKMKEIELAKGDVKYIAKLDLMRKLRSLNSQFILPNEIKILRSKSNVSRMELERKIKNHLLTRCNTCEYSIQINSVPNHLTSDWELDVNTDLNGSIVNVPLYSKSNPEIKGNIIAEIKKYASVPVLIRDTKMNESISDEMITLEKRLVMRHQDIVMDKKAILGMQASRFLNAGQVIYYRDLKREQIIRKGQIVKAIFGQGNLELSISAVTEENGAYGDVIRVKNLDTHKLFAAKVIDRGLVKIE